MITLRLKEIAEALGKNISDIAKETGLNRNTITALYHNKVDGVKFETLEKICSIYKIKLEDILKITTGNINKDKPEILTATIDEPYRQEGDIILFTAFPPFLQFENQPLKWFGDIRLGLLGFFKKNYMKVYWDKKSMLRFSEAVYDRYHDESKLTKLFDEFNIHAKNIKKLYLSHMCDEVVGYSKEELVDFSKTIFNTFAGFWQLSLFIDLFDAGFDVKKIEELKGKYKFTNEEISVLTTPVEVTFNNERLQRLFEIIKTIAKSKISDNPVNLKKYLLSSKEVKKYILDFDYYKSNYAHMNHITIDDMVKEIGAHIKGDNWEAEYNMLNKHKKTTSKNIRIILRNHKLKQNPLYFFQKLVSWREYRKQINLMGIHLMHYTLKAIEIKASIPYEYLKHLTFDEIPGVLGGLVSLDQLKRRYDNGVMISIDRSGYKIIEGNEAQSLSDEMEKKILGQTPEKILTGRVACQGYAKGVARIILGQEDFYKFNEGEILVTGMTRPEFVPLIKKAAAIVTNEGGITCHAAIVSRELNKPCIIGTQKATQIIKDGDLIEVRANHGTVRILNR